MEVSAFYPAHAEAWADAAAWFDATSEAADKVDEDALAWARKTWQPAPPPIRPRTGSLLDAIRLAPHRYRGLVFFFEQNPMDEADANAYRKVSLADEPVEGDVEAIIGCKTDDMFTGLSPREFE